MSNFTTVDWLASYLAAIWSIESAVKFKMIICCSVLKHGLASYFMKENFGQGNFGESLAIH